MHYKLHFVKGGKQTFFQIFAIIHEKREKFEMIKTEMIENQRLWEYTTFRSGENFTVFKNIQISPGKSFLKK